MTAAPAPDPAQPPPWGLRVQTTDGHTYWYTDDANWPQQFPTCAAAFQRGEVEDLSWDGSVYWAEPLPESWGGEPVPTLPGIVRELSEGALPRAGGPRPADDPVWAALAVLATTPHIRQWLHERDPKALAQADAALQRAAEDALRPRRWLLYLRGPDGEISTANNNEDVPIRFPSVEEARAYASDHLGAYVAAGYAWWPLEA